MNVHIIASFTGEYRYLSNFWYIPVEYLGETWLTSEHAYMAAKSHDPIYKGKIKEARTPAAAKKLGRSAVLRPDWEEVKESVMLGVLRSKFRKRKLNDLSALLVGTAPAILVEGNQHGDTYWGVCNGEGKNRLGELLMQVRRELIG